MVLKLTEIKKGDQYYSSNFFLQAHVTALQYLKRALRLHVHVS